MSANIDKAGENYWTEVWERTTLPPPIDLDSKSVNAYPDRVLHNLFKKIIINISLHCFLSSHIVKSLIIILK